MVLATTVRAEVCGNADILRAYQDQTTTVEPGFRWIKNPAAIAPVWLEKPERIAALARLTVERNIGLSKRLASANKQRVLKKTTNGEQALKEPYRQPLLPWEGGGQGIGV